MATELQAAEVRCRIGVDLKARATAVLDACGLSISDAMRLFLRKVIEVEGLPILIFRSLSFVRKHSASEVGGGHYHLHKSCIWL